MYYWLRDTMTIEELEKKASEIRATCVQMACDGRVGHLCSSMAYVDVLVALYHGGWLKHFPAEPKHPGRDRFILSKGHGCTALYAVLADRGFFPVETLAEYNRETSCLPNHPCMHTLPALEMSAGSLGHGLGVATGMLYGLRLKGSAARAAVLLGDGECNEGSVWEAAMFAAAHKLENLLAVVDYNGVQAVGKTDEIAGFTSLEGKFRAFGWAARTIDGADMRTVMETLSAFPFEKGKPSVIIARTKNKVSFMENDVLWHYRVPSEEERVKALAELGAAPIYGRKP